MSPTFIRFKQWLGRLSFRTGIVVATLCVISYIVSFTQMLLPVSATTKGVLWVVFFGLAKTFQYAALLILGTAGLTRIKAIFKCVKINQTAINKHGSWLITKENIIGQPSKRRWFLSLYRRLKKESNRRALSARRLLLRCGAAIIQSRI